MASTGETGSSGRSTRVTSSKESSLSKAGASKTNTSTDSQVTSSNENDSKSGGPGGASSNTGGSATKVTRREVLIRQPSYCKILDDLKGTEAKVASMKQEAAEPQQIEVTTSGGEIAIAAEAVAAVSQSGNYVEKE